jgi:DNA-binding transcriptional LysR family regulator
MKPHFINASTGKILPIYHSLLKNNPRSADRPAMNWDDIRVFLAVARSGGLTGAASRLQMSPATVGRHISALEQALGSHLFARSQSGYALSDAGERLLSDAEEAEGQMERLHRRASGGDMEAEGSVRIALPDNYATLMVLPEIARFQARYPRLVLELVTSISLSSLTRREADVALRLVRPETGNLMISRAGSMASALYASKAYLAEHPFEPGQNASHLGAGHRGVGWDESQQGLTSARWMAEQFPKVPLAVRATSLQSQLAACRGGAGLALLPCLMADPFAELVRLIPPENVYSQDIWLIAHREIAETARVRAVLSFLREVVTRYRPALLGIGAASLRTGA